MFPALLLGETSDIQMSPQSQTPFCTNHYFSHHLSSAVDEPEPVAAEDVIGAAVAEDLSAPPPGTCRPAAVVSVPSVTQWPGVHNYIACPLPILSFYCF